MGGCSGSRLPSDEEREGLENALRLAATPVDEADPEHLELLRTLWHAMRTVDPPPPEAELEEFTVDSYEWKRFGFQAPRPVTDFRGGGLLSLQLMVHCAQRRPQTMGHISRSQRELRRESGYTKGFPVAAAMINTTRAALQACGVMREGGLRVDPGGVRAPYWQEVCADGGLEGLFAAILERTAKDVLDGGLQYAEFNMILQRVRDQAAAALRKQRTVAEVRRQLGLEPDEAQGAGGFSLL
eukprot:TRINITY_DN61676_c0_g1_i1.p1 TRINITY_DN61676_c0_g1~~TRINITY_DN61676_c0_g1_i1.p1  ORF type:complete len:266 (+),score=98.83 TRINITY_DN61676_c0_g1_i1:78-800(+)